MTKTNLAKIAGAILPELNERTLTIEGKALRLYNNDGELRTDAVLGARALLKSRIKHLTKVAKDLETKIIEDLKAGVPVEIGNHTLELGSKTSTSCKWKGYAVELLGCSDKEAEAKVRETEHYSTSESDCLVIDGKKQ